MSFTIRCTDLATPNSNLFIDWQPYFLAVIYYVYVKRDKLSQCRLGIRHHTITIIIFITLDRFHNSAVRISAISIDIDGLIHITLATYCHHDGNIRVKRLQMLIILTRLTVLCGLVALADSFTRNTIYLLTYILRLK